MTRNYSSVTSTALAPAFFPPFFFALAVDVLCAAAIDPIVRNALIQKLAANFK